MKEVVTYSELRSRRRCAYKGHLEYDLRLAPRILKAGLREGGIADAGMNALYMHVRDHGDYDASIMLQAMHDAWDQEQARMHDAEMPPTDEEWAEMEERVGLLAAVAERYVAMAAVRDPFQRIITMQLQGEVPVVAPSGRASTRYQFRFKPDGLVVIRDRLWVLENKWWKTISDDAVRGLAQDEQSSMYLWGLNELHRRGETSGEVAEAMAEYGPAVGVYYNVVRKKLPSIPALLRSGETSKDRRIDTTADVYLETLRARGQDPADYAEILEVLQEKGDTFYYRELISRNEQELREIGARIYQGTRLRAEHFDYKMPERDCIHSCSFRPLCLEWSDEVAAFHFRQKRAAHEEYDEREKAA